jgi:hypothetical protein
MIEHQEEGYDLFRRAILYRDADAWADIHTRYRSLLIVWASRCSARTCTDEWVEDMSDQALARAWAALTPDRFAAFTSLAQLLSYLRACVTTTVLDCARAQLASQRPLQEIHPVAPATPDQTVLADLDRDALWRAVIAAATTPPERVALLESVVYGLPPRQIWARHPQLFPDVAAVYSTKRRLFDRLQRNPVLHQLRQEFCAV